MGTEMKMVNFSGHPYVDFFLYAFVFLFFPWRIFVGYTLSK